MPQEKRPLNYKKISGIVIQVLVDAILINAAWLMAIYTFYDMHVPPEHMNRFIRLWPYITLVCLSAFLVTRMYGRQWRYAGLDEVVRILAGTWLGCFAVYILSLIGYTFQKVPNLFLFRRSIYLFAWLLLFLLVSAQRLGARLFHQLAVKSRAIEPEHRKRVLVVGAGWAGANLLGEMSARGFRDGMPVAVVDDDPAKAGTWIGRVPILYDIENIPAYVKRYAAQEIIIAIPSASNALMQRIMNACATTGCKLRMVPGVQEVGGLKAGKLRDVNIADLLCRDEVKLDMDAIAGYLSGKTVLVTGGGGSIGSELCRQIALFQPKHLVVFDIYENNAYELENELRANFPGKFELTVLIGSVRDVDRLNDVFEQVKPDVVFHAAAHKHVPLMEDSPAEAVKNNIFGTYNVAVCCAQHGVSRMVQISTDKAVNPTNVMGATKRVTELIIQYMARRSTTRFMAVRFGNVLGSNGSVIPLFKKQIERGGPVTVTHPDITRYFMTIPEASQLVLEAGAIGESGRIFVLDMGTPVKIVDLAKNLIHLAGFTPDVDIKIEFCGLRPGEKLYEELAMTEESEALAKTCHDKIMVLKPLPLDETWLQNGLNALRTAAFEHPDTIREPLKMLVPTFREPDTEEKAVG